MINPKDININALPFVEFSDRKSLPADLGIYFVIDSMGNVQYIGQSRNIRNRWKLKF